MKWQHSTLVATTLWLCQVTWAFDAAKTAQAVCSECHGKDGVSQVDRYPNLAGQHATYLLAQLKAFRSGQRDSVEMSLVLANYDTAMLAALAAHYAAQPAAPCANPKTDIGTRKRNE